MSSMNRNEEDTTSLCSVPDDPIHILNVALTTERGVDDVTLNTMFQSFVDSHKVSVNIQLSDLNLENKLCILCPVTPYNRKANEPYLLNWLVFDGALCFYFRVNLATMDFVASLFLFTNGSKFPNILHIVLVNR